MYTRLTKPYRAWKTMWMGRSSEFRWTWWSLRRSSLLHCTRSWRNAPWKPGRGSSPGTIGQWAQKSGVGIAKDSHITSHWNMSFLPIWIDICSTNLPRFTYISILIINTNNHCWGHPAWTLVPPGICWCYYYSSWPPSGFGFRSASLKSSSIFAVFGSLFSFPTNGFLSLLKIWRIFSILSLGK